VIGGRTRFSPDELPIGGGRVTASDLAASMAVARQLDAFALEPTPAPSPAFTSRVMAAVAAEPAPQPVVAFARALTGGHLVAMLGAVRDAWRVSASPGRPTLVRAQALALVLLALLAFGSLAGITGAAVGLFDAPRPSQPLPTRPAIVAPAPSAGPSNEVSPPPSMPTSSPEPSPSSKAPATAGPTARPTQRPIATPRRTASPQPTESEDGGGGGEEPRDADDSPSPSDGSPSPSDHSGPG
jgi:hypothetical protein